MGISLIMIGLEVHTIVISPLFLIFVFYKTILKIVSDDASYVNGASLIVDDAWAISGYPDISKFM
ncbi:hypothetical protein MUB24_08185 [Lederbergia sp. NSJ-179]|uniref:hypothetical protein n=1 Tax=Lederbergia sp. NSJ-179 TaxID=2931402 RepID=UPI001FD5C10D|nr:hypothetical protein [Lederbergia sp. NSJ-179]MCJ7840882.1 hypothetical protein [Lederbergia sp. NSJ-179]